MADFDYNYALAVLDNIRTTVHNNADTELAAIDATLAAFDDYSTPLPLLVRFPAVYVEWAGSKLKKSDDESYCQQEHEFQIGVSIIGTDHTDLTLTTLQYATAIARVIDKMTQANFIGSTSTTLSGVAWEVVDMDASRGYVNSGSAIYRRDTYLTLMVQFIESKG